MRDEDPLWVQPFIQLRSTANAFYAKAVQYAVAEAVELVRGATRAQDRATLDLVSIKREARQAAERDFADIPELFGALADSPDPEAFEAIAEPLRQARNRLAVHGSVDPVTRRAIAAVGDFARVSTISDIVGIWSGDAARAFKTNFLDPLPGKISGQFAVAAVLVGAVEAEAALWNAVRYDVPPILAQGSMALDHVHDMTQAEWTLTFTVLASVAAVAAVPLSGGASLAVTAVGASAQIAAAVPIDDPSQRAYSGRTVREVVDQVRDAVRVVIGQVARAEEEIARGLRANVDTINEHWHEFVSERPDITETTAENARTGRYFGFAH